jgi:hypothetical protein
VPQFIPVDHDPFDMADTLAGASDWQRGVDRASQLGTVLLRKYGIAGLSALPPAVAAHVQSRLIPVDHDPFAGEGNQNQP